MEDLDRMPTVQQVAMKAAIVDQYGKVLVLREAGIDTYSEGSNEGMWHLPGGRLKLGETWQSGLLREVEEETGLVEIDVVSPIFIGEWRPEIKGVVIQIIAVFHLCKYIDGGVKLSEEHDSFAWIGIEDIDEYQFVQPDREVVEMALTIVEGEK